MVYRRRSREARQRGLAAVAACVLAVSGAAGAEPPGSGAAGRLVASKESGWPQWRGRRRDGVSDEKGLLPSWPEDGPRLLWKATGLGGGYCSPIVAGGGIFITGDVGQQLRIFALRGDGKVKWQTVNGQAWKRSYPGSRASCCYDSGKLYHMNAHGRAVCLDAETGKELWAVEVLKRFQAGNVTWGISECLLVDGPRVIVTPAGRKALMAALDKQTGETVWTTPPLAEETADYGSPILVELGGRRCIFACGSRHAFAVDADSGKLLWTFRHEIRKATVSTTPVFHGDSLFITNSHVREHAFYRLRIDPAAGRAEKAWSLALKNNSGSMLLAGGRIYGGVVRDPQGWACVDPGSGKLLHVSSELGNGSAIYADGRLYCLSDRGEAGLLKPSSDGLEVVGRFRLPGAKKNVFAHPVLCDGRLYLRCEQDLYCHDVREAGQ